MLFAEDLVVSLSVSLPPAAVDEVEVDVVLVLMTDVQLQADERLD